MFAKYFYNTQQTLRELSNYRKLNKLFFKGQLSNQEYRNSLKLQETKFLYTLKEQTNFKTFSDLMKNQVFIEIIMNKNADKKLIFSALRDMPDIQHYILKNHKDLKKQKKKIIFYSKTAFVLFLTLYLISLGIKLYYYFEYEIWLTDPEMSDYLLNRYK